ncbi:MAG: 50S ribosomal protein L7/L12 [Parcubacteria group bacterium GW2011_GWC1_45_14]|nr:MAG: 50S ribosomal protein L7/L12 [Parcubacteria group bacterium GW2011_GWC1_45_14]
MQHNDINDADKSHKIDSLRDMIINAEKTIQSAKAMLLQIEGKKKTGRRRKHEDEGDGEIIEGTFDGQIMLGTNGKQYPVPANYASKSKLVEGDMLKLTITTDGSFIYKQIGPIERRHMIGIVSQDEKGNYYIFSEGKPYKVLLASITYFKAQPGDEVALLTPRDIESSWAAIENVLQKGGGVFGSGFDSKHAIDKEIESLKESIGSEEETEDGEGEKKPASTSVVDEWTSDIADLEKEIKAQNPSF